MKMDFGLHFSTLYNWSTINNSLGCPWKKSEGKVFVHCGQGRREEGNLHMRVCDFWLFCCKNSRFFEKVFPHGEVGWGNGERVNFMRIWRLLWTASLRINLKEIVNDDRSTKAWKQNNEINWYFTHFLFNCSKYFLKVWLNYRFQIWYFSFKR